MAHGSWLMAWYSGSSGYSGGSGDALFPANPEHPENPVFWASWLEYGNNTIILIISSSCF
jgi:hypothetical protein